MYIYFVFYIVVIIMVLIINKFYIIDLSKIINLGMLGDWLN